jgi:hypothetical protein
MGKRKALDGTSYDNALKNLVLLFTSLFTIPLTCQCCFDTTLLARLQVVGVTFYFLDDVFLLYLAFKPAQCVLKRFAFLQANLGQKKTPPNMPERANTHHSYGCAFIQLRENPRIFKHLRYAHAINLTESLPKTEPNRSELPSPVLHGLP